MWGMLAALSRLRGRANRALYWKVLGGFYGVLIVVLVVPIALVTAGSANRAGQEPRLSILLFFAAFGVVVMLWAMWIFFATAIRRLHDRNKSAWWAIPFFLVPAVFDVAARFETPNLSEMTGRADLFALIAAGFAIWAFIEIACLRGTTGENRFGPDPLAGRLVPSEGNKR